MEHVRGAPYHPQTQGKIERWHQTLKNRILLNNYYLSGDLERQISAFVEHYNNARYHASLDNRIARLCAARYIHAEPKLKKLGLLGGGADEPRHGMHARGDRGFDNERFRCLQR
jgi:transposase InsO family protein